MILVVDVGNTRIKAAVLREYPFATFCFLLKELRKILKIF
jgi:pantothenate kinase type III